MRVDTKAQGIDVALTQIIRGLSSKGYRFVTCDTSVQEMQHGLVQFDEGRLWLGGKLFSFVLGGSDLPAFAQSITEHVVGLGTEEVEDAELEKLQQLMRDSFPLCAFAFSKIWGPRFTAVANGDEVSPEELFTALDRFEVISHCMMELGGRLTLKLFGKSVLGLNGSAATGSLLLVASTTERAVALRQWVASKPLRSDTIVNQLKERFSRWQFWAKAAIGMIEYKPHQLRQEVIVVDAQSSQATSTASPRFGFEFGFSLSDIVTGSETNLVPPPGAGQPTQPCPLPSVSVDKSLVVSQGAQPEQRGTDLSLSLATESHVVKFGCTGKPEANRTPERVPTSTSPPSVIPGCVGGKSSDVSHSPAKETPNPPSDSGSGKGCGWLIALVVIGSFIYHSAGCDQPGQSPTNASTPLSGAVLPGRLPDGALVYPARNAQWSWDTQLGVYVVGNDHGGLSYYQSDGRRLRLVQFSARHLQTGQLHYFDEFGNRIQ